MNKKRKRGGLYAIVVAVVVAAIIFGLSIHPGSTTLAAAVEEYIGGLEVGGTSYEVIKQTENEAEIIVYLEIIENGQTQRVPKENLLLRKDDAGNWGIVRAMAITTLPTETDEPEEQSEEPPEQPPENQEQPPEERPAELYVTGVSRYSYCTKGETITFKIEVYNSGGLPGTIEVEVLVDGNLIKSVEIYAESERMVWENVTLTFNEIRDYKIEVAGYEWIVMVGGIKDWWDDDIMRESVMKVFGEYFNEYVLEEIPGVAWLYKGEPSGGYGFGPYDREGDVVIIKGHIIYGTVPNLKVDYWLAKIDLSTYQVVDFYEIAE